MKINIDFVYPIGSIYFSVNSTNPSTLFGGTWEQIKDRFLLACGSTYSNGSTGGEATHKLTTNELPSHNHGLGHGVMEAGNSAHNFFYGGSSYEGALFATGNTGGDQEHNNMPPYLAVYVWKRTA